MTHKGQVYAMYNVYCVAMRILRWGPVGNLILKSSCFLNWVHTLLLLSIRKGEKAE